MKRYFEVHTFSTSLKSNQTMAFPCSLWNIGFVNNDFSFLLLLIEFCDENELDLLHDATTIKHFFTLLIANAPCCDRCYFIFTVLTLWLLILFFYLLGISQQTAQYTGERERVRHVYSYSYVVCWQKQTKELMRFVWINNNFTHSCFIISHSSSAIIRNIASSLSFPFHTWIIMRIIFCVSAISEDFFLLVLHPVSESKKKLKCASLDDEGSKNQRSRYIYSRRNFPLLL